MKMNQYIPSNKLPYADLYIYYLKGHINQHATSFGDTFLGNWEEDGSSFLFFSDPSDAEIDKLIEDRPDLTLVDHYQMSYEEWIGGSLEPFQVGRFFIHTPWQRPKTGNRISDERIDIPLDPGVVFGTGKHTTTRDCLEAIEMAFSYDAIQSAIDFGTGTGLLAIAAAKLGCPLVLAMDFNYLAIQTTLRNIRLNRFHDQILAIHSSAEYFLDNNTDLVVANIHFDVMKRLLSSKGFLGQKFFILSGLLRSQAKEVASKLSHYQVDILKTWDDDGIWHTFLGRVC